MPEPDDTPGNPGDPGDRLRERLRALDPAASLSPADPADRDRLLEETMADPRSTPARPGRPDRPSAAVFRRRRLTVLAAAAAAVAVVGGGVVMLTHGGSDTQVADPTPSGTPTATQASPGSSSGGPSTSSGGAPAATRLTAVAAVGRCAVPTVGLLKGQDVAFEGTVTSLAGGIASITPTTVYTGDPGAVVTVKAPGKDLQDLVSAVDFSVGGDYLVAAADGRVAVCGLSGPATASLASLYADAFAR